MLPTSPIYLSHFDAFGTLLNMRITYSHDLNENLNNVRASA